MVTQHSETFKRFVETAVKAYMIIRKNAHIFINLFSMVNQYYSNPPYEHIVPINVM